ncbi:MAG: iron-containing alcohol dehydrogenase [Candidatus Hydrogenedentota bacterium]
MSVEKLGWHSLGTAFDCACGVRHELPIEECHVGGDAAKHLADFARARCGRHALVVSDENTRQVGGEPVLSALGAVGKRVTEKVYPGEPLEATEERANEVARAGQECDFYVGIGAGTLSDLAKSAGGQQDKPVLLFPTAASMNGYTSAIVALKVRGLKATLPCKPAVGVFADPAVVATAPQRMVAAGVADFLSKCSSASDWYLGHRLRGGYFCARPREFNEGIQERLFAEAGAIGRGEPAGVGLALEALLLSGLGMVVAGSSAPASGGEHLVSHYLDMKHALYGTANDLHGVQVGVATVYTLRLWEQVLALDPKDADLGALVAAYPDAETIRARVMEDWGDQVGAEVWAQWEQKAVYGAALREEAEKFFSLQDELRERLAADLEPAETVAACIETCGGPARPEDMAADTHVFYEAVQRARYIRNRLTILDLAAEVGVAPA